MKCFKCIGRGRMASQCPNRHTIILREDEGFESEDEAIEEFK